MKIYFNNDGSFGSKAIGAPVVFNDIPIGYVCDVSESKVSLHIWDRFVNINTPCINISTREQDIMSIEIKTKE